MTTIKSRLERPIGTGKRFDKRRQPLVSVILPVFNGEDFVSMAIDSILGQTYKKLELIIVDDASSDRSADIVSGIHDPRIKFVSLKKNKGPAFARNLGLRLSRGKWVGFIDADDCWDRSRIKKLLDLAERHEQACAASDVLVCLSGRNKQLIPKWSICQKMGHAEKVFYYESMEIFANQGFDLKPICPTSVLRKHNIIFRTDTRGSEWREFLFRLFRAGLSIYVLNQPLYKYRVTPHSLSSRYCSVQHEIETADHLMALAWISYKAKQAILRNRKIMVYRLLSTAIRERKWKEALIQMGASPASLYYLARRFPKYFFERIVAGISE